MFESLMVRAGRRAKAKAEARARSIAEELAAAAPSDVAIEAVEEGVRLSGRHLRRRLALEPELRGLLFEIGR